MQRILVGLDASAQAPAVLSAAIDLAKRTGAKLKLFRAVGLPVDLPTNVWTIPAQQIVDSFLETARAELGRFAKQVPSELLEGTSAQVGIAWDALCAVAREEDVDMIVIGSHGHRFLDRLIGTTAAKVVDHADRSVLVVRPREAHASA